MRQRNQGLALQTEFQIWRGIRRRVHDASCKDYPEYGGRGIEICEEWDRDEDGYKNFLNSVGPRPSPQHSVERLDNDGDYTSENCEWALPVEQARNRRKRNGISAT
jgi:hypothetical protein